MSCRACGGPTSPSKWGQRKYCQRPACQDAARRAGGRRSAEVRQQRLAERKHKRCVVCRELKALTGEHWYVTQRAPDGSPRRWDSYCKPCKRADQRERYKTSGERRAAAQRRALEQRREINARVAVDPDFAAEWETKRRHWQERRRARRQQPEPAPAPAQSGGTKLDIAPFSEWLAARVDTYGSPEDMAKVFGCDGSSLRKIIRREDGGRPKRFVHETFVDEILTQEGSTLLMDLYPELYEESAA